MTKILIISSGYENEGLLELLANKSGITLIAVVDKDQDSPAIVSARQLNIRTGKDPREFLKEKPDIVINLDGQRYVEDVHAVESETEIIGGRSAALMFDLVREAKTARKQAAFQSDRIAQVRNATVVTNLNGEVQYWNRYAEDMFQWRADETAGKSFFQLILPGDRRAEADELLATVLLEGFWEGEIAAQKKDGSQFSVFMNNTVLRDHTKAISIVSISSDITELKRPEEAFRMEAGFRKAIEDAVLPGIVAYDREGRQLCVNQGFCSIVGWSEEELVGTRPPFPYWPQEELQRNSSVFDSILKGTEGAGGVELLFRRRNGELFNAIVLTAPFYDDYGNVKGWVSSISDITEYKRREKRLRGSRRQLRAFAYHLEMEREAEKKETARRVHDEIGQPLAALKLELASLARKLEDDQKALFDRTGIMNSIIDEGIKAVKRICTELRPWVLDDMGIVEAVKWQVVEFGRRMAIGCELTISPQDISLNRDLSTTVFRVLQEMLRNIELHAGATKVCVSLEIKHGMVFMEVKDNGGGIAKEQIHDPKSYGLISIRERVFAWGGNGEITGEVNIGTVIRISIPLPV